MLDALWGGFVGNLPLRPGSDGPPQDPMNERKNRKKERVGGRGAENESEGVERVTLVFIGMPEEAWLRCGPAPETR